MPDSDHRRLRSLFEQALELPSTAREAFLVARCGSDAALKQRLQAMLAAAADERFLASPTGIEAGMSAERAVLAEGVGAHIGPYHLLEEIGEGGFGLVFLAEQQQPVSRRVALKIVKVGMDTRQVVARFEQERQALALMDHPNIARVLDAGATASGRPYFVMDLVRGLPILEHCDRRKLTIAERLAIFAQICDAVQHAHGKGVIHRDLKPSNVLVTMHDDRPVAKVIDFGVAKAMTHPLTDKTLLTEQRQILGTLHYMSPEQADGSPDIDTRTDVYALGVMLYELLTGSTPFEFVTTGGGSFGELQRRILETDPPTPSLRLTESKDRLKALADQRRADPLRLASALRGELDWMVMKALEKDRARRYETAAAFGHDVRAFLAGAPIDAAPPSAGYRLRKFVARNRALVGASFAVAVSLLLGVVGTTMAMFEARTEQRRADAATAAETSAKELAIASAKEAKHAAEAAEAARAIEAQERRKAETMHQFVLDALQASNASQGGRADTTIVTAMQNALALLDGERFRDDPLTAAVLRGAIGVILRNNGRFEDSLDQAQRSLAVLQQWKPGDHSDTAAALADIGSAFDQLGRDTEAETYFRDALAMYRRLYPGDNEHTAAMLNNLGSLREKLGHAAEAEALVGEALTMQQRLFPEGNVGTAMMLDNLAKAESALGKVDAARAHYEDAVAMQRRLHPDGHPRVAVSINNLAVLYAEQGDSRRALELLDEALAMRRRLYPVDHPSLAESLLNLAFLRTREGQAQQALPLLEEGVAMNARLFPGAHPLVAHGLYTLATTQLELDDAPSARGTAERSVAMHRQLFAGAHLGTAMSLVVLARAEVERKEYESARQAFDEALAMLRTLPSGRDALRDTLWRSGEHRFQRGDAAGAEVELKELLQLATEDLPDDALQLRNCKAALEQCRKALQAPGK